MKIGNTLLRLLAVMNIIQGDPKHLLSIFKIKFITSCCDDFCLVELVLNITLFVQEIEFNEIYRILRANATCKVFWVMYGLF